MTKDKRTRGVAQVVEHLPTKAQALNSNPSTTKKERKKNNTHLAFFLKEILLQ
jgi:hypothetical protein